MVDKVIGIIKDQLFPIYDFRNVLCMVFQAVDQEAPELNKCNGVLKVQQFQRKRMKIKMQEEVHNKSNIYINGEIFKERV